VIAAEETLPVLQVGTHTYSNVTVTTKNPRYIVIMHSEGLASIKLKELSKETLKTLGYKVEEPPPASATKSFLPQNVELDPKIKDIQEKTVAEIKEFVQRLDSKMLIAILGGVVLLYLFVCYCFMLICKKAGGEPGVLVWVPLLQVFPLLKAASMSPWCVVLGFVPIINGVVFIIWFVRICRARGKSSWLALSLLLPITSALTFLYLAFADSLAEEAPARITFN